MEQLCIPTDLPKTTGKSLKVNGNPIYSKLLVLLCLSMQKSVPTGKNFKENLLFS
jgi:hypothetical protein